METFEMPFKLGNDAKAALVGEICTCRLWRQNRAAFNSKFEIECIETNYTFYFGAFLRKIRCYYWCGRRGIVIIPIQQYAITENTPLPIKKDSFSLYLHAIDIENLWRFKKSFFLKIVKNS